jgi:hypothetical protein
MSIIKIEDVLANPVHDKSSFVTNASIKDFAERPDHNRFDRGHSVEDW